MIRKIIASVLTIPASVIVGMLVGLVFTGMGIIIPSTIIARGFNMAEFSQRTCEVLFVSVGFTFSAAIYAVTLIKYVWTMPDGGQS